MDYFPEVIQVIPTEDYRVYIYFDDGSIKLFDAKNLVGQGVFAPLIDREKFLGSCKVLNHTLAWDLKGNYDETECLDLDPLELYRTCPEVEEPAGLFKSQSGQTSR